MTLLETTLRPTCALPRLLGRAGSAEIARALDTAGCVIVENAAPANLLAHITSELAPWFEDAYRGEGRFFGRETKRFSAIFAKAPSAAHLALHEAILPALESTLLGPAHDPHGDCIQLNLTQAIEIEPGQGAQLLHRDDGLFPMAKSFELMVNVMWTLDDFTAQNGATRLAPGSHLWARQDIEQYDDEVVSAECPRGSAIIWLGSLIHGGGANRSRLSRRGLVLSYSLAWLAQAEKLLVSTPPDIARGLPEKLQRLIGYQVHKPNLGWVEGNDPLAWLRGDFDALAPAQDNLTPVQRDMMEHYLKAVGRA